MKKRNILLILIIICHLFPAASQNIFDHTSQQWYLNDPIQDNVAGINLHEAYQYLEGKETKTVVVAIIDSGVDFDHEDLQEQLWVNKDEIAGNGIDDDNNGYIDDIHGWNFLGNSSGENLLADSYEITRVYAAYRNRFEGMDPDDVPKNEKEDYEYYLYIKSEFEKEKEEAKQELESMMMFFDSYFAAKKILDEHFEPDEYTLDDVFDIDTEDENVNDAVSTYMLLNLFGMDPWDMEEYYLDMKDDITIKYNPDFNARVLIGDDPYNMNDSIYGNNDYDGGSSGHGTSVAGVVAAVRGNGVGIDGIAPNVKIMIIRVVPSADERDKDVAMAIRYAVQNGADIINCSFGKAYSPEKYMVDDAVLFAQKHDVLIVHASGNESLDNDKTTHFPTRVLNDKSTADNFLEVGANTQNISTYLISNFSNYGKTSVDLFAPGSYIITLKPNDRYGSSDGTSLAAPIATGVAAFILSYFPELTAAELRQILIKSVTSYKKMKVECPGGGTKKVGSLCISGGVINTYSAIKHAEKIMKKRH